MESDKFKLGNFEEEEKKLEEIDLPSQVEHDIEQIEEQEKERGLIEHPTVDIKQTTFFSHDGKPLQEIELDKIVPNEFQPRRIFDPAALQELADSIKAHGIIQPIVVTEREDGKYEIIVGERRFRASKMAGLKKVPAFVSPKLTDRTKLEIALIENVQRSNLNPIEEGKAYQRLNQEFGLTTREIGKQVGKDNSTISNLMRLLKLPVEIQKALVESTVAEGQVRPLLSLGDREEMLAMFEVIKKKGLKVREIESKVREIKQRKIKVHEMYTPDPFLSSLENMLRSKLGARVEVNKGAKGGKITIEFFSDDELNDIVNKIA